MYMHIIIYMSEILILLVLRLLLDCAGADALFPNFERVSRVKLLHIARNQPASYIPGPGTRKPTSLKWIAGTGDSKVKIWFIIHWPSGSRELIT